jgi:hypothetical protein
MWHISPSSAPDLSSTSRVLHPGNAQTPPEAAKSRFTVFWLIGVLFTGLSFFDYRFE